MTIVIHSCDFFRFSMDGSGEEVSLVLKKHLALKEGDRIEVVLCGASVFDGDVSHVSFNKEFQLIQAVIVSVASGGDATGATIFKACREIGLIRKNLTPLEWEGVRKRVLEDS